MRHRVFALLFPNLTQRRRDAKSVVNLGLHVFRIVVYPTDHYGNHWISRQCHWSEREGTERSIFLMGPIEEGLHEWKLHKALNVYKDHRVTLWRAAEIAGVSLSELLAELPKQKIIFQYDMAELNEDLEYARGK